MAVFVVLDGTVATEPKFRAFGEEGQGFLSFRVLTRRSYAVKRDGNWTREPDFFSVDYRTKADTKLMELLKKNQPLTVMGTLENREVERDGTKTVYTTIKATNIQLVGSPREKAPTSDVPANDSPEDGEGGVPF